MVIRQIEVERSPGRLAKLRVQGKGKKAFGAFKHYVLTDCPDLRYCQIIATSAKHLGYDMKPQDPEFETDAARAEVTWLNNLGQPVNWVNNKGQPVRWTLNAWELRIVEGETRKRAIEVFGSVLGWWAQFLAA
jgi:hypothetical protein